MNGTTLATAVVGILLALYVYWVLRRKISRFRKGSFCDCDQTGCSPGSCGRWDEEKAPAAGKPADS